MPKTKKAMKTSYTDSDYLALFEEIDIYDFFHYKRYLKEAYDHIKGSSKGFTFEKFSNLLGNSKPNYVSSILASMIPLTNSMAPKIVKHLKWKGAKAKYFVAMVQYSNNTDPEKSSDLLKEMVTIRQKRKLKKADTKWLEITSEWYHLPILELVSLKRFKYDIEWIRKNLYFELRPLQIKKSIELLENLGLIEIKGDHITIKENVDTGPEIGGIELSFYHTEMIRLSQIMLTKVPGQKRDYSSLTVSLDEEAVQKIKDEIHKLQDLILKYSDESSDRRQVYNINTQFFPVTNIEDDA